MKPKTKIFAKFKAEAMSNKPSDGGGLLRVGDLM
jgi:hypothetical protein